MKKNLFYLFALICSMTLFTACSDDDDPTPEPEPEPSVPTATLLAGEYSGTLKLALGEGTEPIEAGTDVPIQLTAVTDNTVNISLTNFMLGGEEGIPLDIVVNDCTVTFDENNVATISGEQTLQLALFPGEDLPTTVTGTCDGTDLSLSIHVTNAPLVSTVDVTYTGTK